MKKLLLLFIIAPFSIFGQDCDCSQNLDWLITTFEKNDAGFQYVIDQKGNTAYESHNEKIKSQAAKINNVNECASLFKQWTTFFRKGHVSIRVVNKKVDEKNTPSDEEIKQLYKDTEKVKVTEESLKKTLQNKVKETDIEGVWQSGSYTIGICKDKKLENRTHVGFIIEGGGAYWEKGQVKMEIFHNDNSFSAKYYMRDHSLEEFSDVELIDNNYLKTGFITWQRIWPKFVDNSKIALHFELLNAQKPMIKEISSQALLLRIPSFGYSHKKQIDSLLKENHELLLSHPNLIIDLRNNGGGSDNTYKEVIPYLYTNPIRIVGVQMLSTPLNNQRMEEFSKNMDFPESDRTWAKEKLEVLNQNLGEFVNLNGDIVSIDTLDQILPNPSKIAILVNQNCGSTTEQFLLAAKQSQKVKLFGTRTYGALDISNMYFVPSPDGQLQLGYCLSKSYRIPNNTIDGVGIQPDFFIDNSIPEYDWIDFALDRL